MEHLNQRCSCPYCNTEFESRKQCGYHKPYCKQNPDREQLIITKRSRNTKSSQYTVTCSECGKQFVVTLTPHQYHKKTHFYCSRSCANTRHHDRNTYLKISKALTKIRPQRQCVSCGKPLSRHSKTGYCRNCVTKTDMFRQRISETLKRRGNAGGYRTNASRGHHGWYKGYYCDSSWELAYVIYNIEHDIKFNRNYDSFTYNYDNKSHKYYPDFIIDDVYIEIKGRWSRKWQAKLDQFPSNKKLLVLTKLDMKPYLDYVISKYGRNFIRLYESNCDVIDYSKPHWYTNTLTGQHTISTKKLASPWVYGRLCIDKLNLKKD